jgi:hypothetical protein
MELAGWEMDPSWRALGEIGREEKAKRTGDTVYSRIVGLVVIRFTHSPTTRSAQRYCATVVLQVY